MEFGGEASPPLATSLGRLVRIIGGRTAGRSASPGSDRREGQEGHAVVPRVDFGPPDPRVAGRDPSDLGREEPRAAAVDAGERDVLPRVPVEEVQEREATARHVEAVEVERPERGQDAAQPSDRSTARFQSA